MWTLSSPLEPLFASARAADARHAFGRRHVGIAWRRACAAWRSSAREYGSTTHGRETIRKGRPRPGPRVSLFYSILFYSSLVRATVPGAAVARATGREAAGRTLAAPTAVDRFDGLLALGWRARVVPPGELLACRSRERVRRRSRAKNWIAATRAQLAIGRFGITPRGSHNAQPPTLSSRGGVEAADA